VESKSNFPTVPPRSIVQYESPTMSAQVHCATTRQIRTSMDTASQLRSPSLCLVSHTHLHRSCQTAAVLGSVDALKTQVAQNRRRLR